MWYSVCGVNRCSTIGCGAEHFGKGLCKTCYNRAYYAANREKVLAKQRRTAVKRAEEKRQYQRAYYRRNAEAERDRVRSWNAENKDKKRSSYRTWAKANPQIVQSVRHRHRARQLSAPGTYTPEEWLDRLSEYGGVCPCCGRVAELTVDHIIPLAKGGTNWIWNLQPLCFSCNSAKSDRHSTYYPPPCHAR